MNLSSKSLNIRETIYDSRWLEGDVAYKRMVLQIMMRCQKPEMLQGLKFFTVSLGTFGRVGFIEQVGN